MAELSNDQKDLVRKVLADLLAPFRKADADEAHEADRGGGGFDKLHMAFYKNMDIGNDGVWDVWQIEGPACSGTSAARRTCIRGCMFANRRRLSRARQD